MVQQIAECAVRDGCSHRDVVALSKLGSSGAYPSNINAELIRKLQPPPIKSAMSRMEVWVKNKFHRHKVTHPIMLPHELFATLYSQHRDIFDKVICGGESNPPSKFWTSVAAHPMYESHPAKLRDNHVHKCIPLTVHGDGVGISGVGKAWQRSIDAWSWTSLLSSGSTIDTQFLIYLMYPTSRIKEEGYDMCAVFERKLAWSLYWLFVGKWPTRDDQNRLMDYDGMGTDLAGGFYATLWGIRGDLEFMYKHFNFPWYHSGSPCGCCKANSGDKPWTDIRENSSWKSSVYTNAAWKLEHPGANALWSLPGMGIVSYILDAMRVLHLGCYQKVYGSILKYLSHHHLPGSPDENAQVLWSTIKRYYKDHGVEAQLGDLRCSMYVPKKATAFPELKAKAAEVRHLAEAMHALCLEYMDDATEVHKQMKLLTKLAVTMESIMDEYKDEFVLPPEAAATFKESAYGFCGLTTQLGHHFHAQGHRLFNYTIKFHYLCHLGDAAAFWNPRKSWCYAGEDLMHKVKLMIQGAQRGARPHVVVAKVLNKYVFGLGLRLQGTVWKK